MGVKHVGDSGDVRAARRVTLTATFTAQDGTLVVVLVTAMLVGSESTQAGCCTCSSSEASSAVVQPSGPSGRAAGQGESTVASSKVSLRSLKSTCSAWESIIWSPASLL